MSIKRESELSNNSQTRFFFPQKSCVLRQGLSIVAKFGLELTMCSSGHSQINNAIFAS
jgi:hypothetical protein